MNYNTLISCKTLNNHLNQPDWVIIDCRFSLANPTQGKNTYQHGHIPHARYAHLDYDLSSSVTPFTGRHPLPDFRVLVKKLGHWGVSNHTQVIVYDDAGGAFAGRLWWMLRYWLGHEKVAVLDGGIQSWQTHFGLVTTLPQIKPTTFRPYLNDTQWFTATRVQNALAQKNICLIDARTPERFRGEVELIDFVAGHIPYALNRPFQSNLDKSGLFLSAEKLHSQFQLLIGNMPPENVVHYCGSGVTACHNLLAMEYAGLSGSKLYAGSWSEWIRNQNRSISINQNVN
jgi:thiosulfate/3-mercaptopyruvate sulfurtransferase